MTDIEIDSDIIRFDGEKVVVRHPVKKSIQKEDVLIVLLDVPSGKSDNRNVIGFSSSGRRLWEIDPISDSPTADQPYVNLFEEDEDVWVYNPIGAKCRIDVATGDFTERKQQKW